jgi:hypothetical protein
VPTQDLGATELGRPTSESGSGKAGAGLGAPAETSEPRAAQVEAARAARERFQAATTKTPSKEEDPPAAAPPYGSPERPATPLQTQVSILSLEPDEA